MNWALQMNVIMADGEGGKRQMRMREIRISRSTTDVCQIYIIYTVLLYATTRASLNGEIQTDDAELGKAVLRRHTRKSACGPLVGKTSISDL